MPNSEKWIVHKFGGTSVANADRYRGVVKILKESSQGEKRAVVVSAMSKVTDALIELTRLAEKRDSLYEKKLEDLYLKHRTCASELLSASAAIALHDIFQKDFADIKEILRGIWHARSCPESSQELVSGYGEIWSAQLLHHALVAAGFSSSWLDARDVLVVEPFRHSVAVRWPESTQKAQSWFAQNPTAVVVVTGFVASSPTGVATTLKRNGSDYSASIFGQLLAAQEIVIWTDVDGVMSADPRLVPDAVVLHDMSYTEASELAYFGAKVVHPDTMGPAILNKIPIWIKNTFRPELRGTRIWTETSVDMPVKGFATIENISVVNIEGTGMIGVPGVAERLFGALKDVGVSVIMISQASSEQSICFAVPHEHGDLAKQAVEKTFAAEIHRHEIQNVKLVTECSVLAMVGDGMAQSPGMASRLFSALGKARTNILAIAQGSSERNISVVIEKSQIHRAVRAAHSALFLSHQTLSVGVIGTGVVGATFLDQLAARCAALKKERGIDVRLRGIANSKTMHMSETGSPIGEWKTLMAQAKTPCDLNEFARFIGESHYPHSVIIDLSASEATTRCYEQWLQMGLNLITANKKAGSGEMEYYQRLQKTARKTHRYFLYETTVGAGLPVIRTLRDLIETGDELIEIEGVLSGTLSFLFNSYDGTSPFSDVLKTAKEKGFTEPDPRDDLSGLDVGRKLVILAREAKLDVQLEKVEIENLVPPELRHLSVGDFLAQLTKMDAALKARFDQARSQNQVLRYVGHVARSGSAQVKLQALPATHPFARLGGSDNIVLLRTRRYEKQPMVIQGPGAGPAVTAAGVFAELLRLADFLGAPQ